MIITIGGQAGSGKSSVGELLAKRLGYKYWSMGDIRREMARKRGMSLREFNRLGEREDFTDKEVDEFQRELGEKDNLVINGRTSYYFIPDSVKICLVANVDERARRVFRDRDRQNETFRDLEDAKEKILERDRSDTMRYRKVYGIDVSDEKNYDYIVDTSDLTEEQVVDRIIGLLKRDSLL
jgi:cytidylate kinase